MEKSKYDFELVNDEFKHKSYDHFILAPNIEMRSIAAYKKVLRFNRIDNIIAADYESFHVNTSKDQDRSILSNFPNEKLTLITVKDDSDLFKQLQNYEFKQSNTIAVDITGFSIPTIYKIMYFFHNKLSLDYIDVFYTEPKHYIYKEAYFDSYHIRTLNRSCNPIPGFFFTGRNQDEVLTIFLGFDHGLADLVYNKLGDGGAIRTIAINGFPSYTPKLKDISLYNNQSLISQLQEDDVMSVTANNPFDTCNLLFKIQKQHPESLINICTIGCKPMALGACLFALNNLNKESIRVTYPDYTKTEFDASEQSGKTWRYGINLTSDE